jgi:3-hydroxybutyryl-CoA dehydrogenase
MRQDAPSVEGTEPTSPRPRCRLCLEAIVERLEPKKECFARLDRICPPHAILATNSSTLGNSLLAPSTRRPEKCVNMHFFYPPLVMRLVEVVKGQWTSEEALQLTAEVARGRPEPVVLRGAGLVN